MEDLKLTVKDLKPVNVTKLKEFVNNLDDDAELYVGIGDTMSRCGTNPLDIDEFINPMYVISERQMDGTADKYIVQEYPVSVQDYCKIQKGQTVTLDIPDSRLEVCKVVKIE